MAIVIHPKMKHSGKRKLASIPGSLAEGLLCHSSDLRLATEIDRFHSSVRAGIGSELEPFFGERKRERECSQRKCGSRNYRQLTVTNQRSVQFTKKENNTVSLFVGCLTKCASLQNRIFGRWGMEYDGSCGRVTYEFPNKYCRRAAAHADSARAKVVRLRGNEPHDWQVPVGWRK
jgi:hypothetical protein